jgi:hypothetical protein
MSWNCPKRQVASIDDSAARAASTGRDDQNVITLGDISAKGMTMLELAWRRCDCRGRLPIARLIAEHRRDDDDDLRALIAHDCLKMQNSSSDIYDRRGGALSRIAEVVLRAKAADRRAKKAPAPTPRVILSADLARHRPWPLAPEDGTRRWRDRNLVSRLVTGSTAHGGEG